MAIRGGDKRVSDGFPAAPQALDTGWLSRATGTEVHAFEAFPLGEGVGVIGWVNRVRLDTDAGPASVIAKFASPSADNRAVAATYDMYGREVHFYRELADRVPIRTPRCLAAEYDAGSHDFVLLLEDLGDCRTGDQVAGAGYEDAVNVVRTLGRLHAATWNAPLAGVRSHDFPAQREGIAQGFRLGWPAVQERFGDLLEDSDRRRLDDLADHIGAFVDFLTTGPQSLVHADVRLDNVLFDGDDVVLVDWQSVCTCSGEQDLAYFLTQSLDDRVRERHLHELVTLYHDTLTEQGVAGHGLDDCRERLRVASLYLFAWAVVIAGTLDLGNERGQLLARALLGRSLRSLTELDAFSLLD